MMDNQTKSPVSFLAHVARLPQKGMPVVIDADEKERAALAVAHGLVAVERYRAELLVAPWKRHGVKVSGTVEADIVQECVVTLDPIENHIAEAVEAVYLPEDSKLGRLGFQSGGEIVLDAEGPDSPETFSGDTIDVGALAEEFFGLGIDPYPRKAGAEITPVVDSENEAEGPLQQKLRLLRSKI
ncbi:YceD family protein [Mesorhizobium sp. L-8-3]|uniref:YceD family protein n=1 Tax=Mesorhizobium sp. L-8-3 TaxID=2744522 RepID=UPI0019268415|nr:DUF177 domain-containing protein [Mesorhizobium sp. L-8-3]